MRFDLLGVQMAVTASAEQQRLLLDLQALDTKLLQLAHSELAPLRYPKYKILKLN